MINERSNKININTLNGDLLQGQDARITAIVISRNGHILVVGFAQQWMRFSQNNDHKNAVWFFDNVLDCQ